MSRKDFQLIASLLNRHLNVTATHPETVSEIIWDFAQTLNVAYPNFNVSTFLEAACIEVAA